jgi:hypothetical protein
MNNKTDDKRIIAFRLLTVLAIVLLAVAYVSPVWWVSLRAPQYPDSAFPDGIRIHFHVDSVQNGCKFVKKAELHEDESLNCKHEMDAINHYVGMYPIAAGGPVERAFSPFLFSYLALMMIAFAAPAGKVRLGILGAGTATIVAWMAAAFFTSGGVKLLSPAYVSDMADTMNLTAKEYGNWTAFKAIEESYREALGRYFRDTAEIAGRTTVVMGIAKALFWVIALGVVGLFFAVWKVRPAVWLLALGPAIVPLAFVVEYSAWLWWFGHNLHEMAAFSLKPFMPTVFGQGKVAQFSTFSYPHYGFGLMVASAACVVLAMLIRRKLGKEGVAGGL